MSRLASYTTRNTGHSSRPIRIALGFAGVGHGRARTLGYQQWRQELKFACWSSRYRHLCQSLYPNMPGTNTRNFCNVQSKCFLPESTRDTLARSAIIDAMVLGCIPVLLHKGQMRLWTHYWNITAATILLDMRSINASEVFNRLTSVSDTRVAELQMHVRLSWPTMVYTTNIPNALTRLQHLLSLGM